MPEHGRVQLATRYQPAPSGSQVGGDWYDAFTLRDGTLALVIGDVVGHDLTAAAGMAQLQDILRSLAWDHTGPTGAVMDRLDDAMHAITTVRWPTLSSPGWKAGTRGPGRFAGPVPGTRRPCCRPRREHAVPRSRAGTDSRNPPGRRQSSSECRSRPAAGANAPAVHRRPDRAYGQRSGQRARPTAPPCPRLAHEPLHTLCDQLSARIPPGSTDDIALLALR